MLIKIACTTCGGTGKNTLPVGPCFICGGLGYTQVLETRINDNSSLWPPVELDEGSIANGSFDLWRFETWVSQVTS